MVHNSIKHRGGRRLGAGAKPLNRNAVKDASKTLGTLDLSTAQACLGALDKIASATWNGTLGTRQAGALNNTVAIKLRHFLNLKQIKELSEEYEQQILEARNLIAQVKKRYKLKEETEAAQ